MKITMAFLKLYNLSNFSSKQPNIYKPKPCFPQVEKIFTSFFNFTFICLFIV